MKSCWLILLIVVFFCGCRERSQSVAESKNEGSLAGKKSGDMVRLQARPDTISFDVAEAAVLVVDMQNDFGTKGGMFDQAGIDISGIQKVINPIADVLKSARQKEMLIIYLKMGYKPDLSDLGSTEFPTRRKRVKRLHIGDTVTAPNGQLSRVLVHDTWNTGIVKLLQPQPNDIVIHKNRFNGFYRTPLDSILRSQKKKYLIVTGCTTSVCVESTVRDAAFRGFMPIVLEDCTAEPIGQSFDRSNHEASLLTIQTSFGLISSSKEFIKAVEGRDDPDDQ